MKGYKNKKGSSIWNKSKLGSYVKRVIKIAQEAKPGTVSHTIISHDDWCDIYKGKPCNCDPDIEVLTDEEYHRRQQ